jgi:hypothetical protein
MPTATGLFVGDGHILADGGQLRGLVVDVVEGAVRKVLAVIS